MKKPILLSTCLILSVIGLSCEIFKSSDNDECNCTETTYHYEGVQFISGVREIPCNSELKALSEKGKTKFIWFAEEEGKTKCEAINCSGYNKVRIVDCDVIDYMGEQFYVDCPEGRSW